ncbi:MAG: hypothetical protein ACK53L_07300, partial [Pirellulaceae bacterium]
HLLGRSPLQSSLMLQQRSRDSCRWTIEEGHDASSLDDRFGQALPNCQREAIIHFVGCRGGVRWSGMSRKVRGGKPSCSAGKVWLT